MIPMYPPLATRIQRFAIKSNGTVGDLESMAPAELIPASKVEFDDVGSGLQPTLLLLNGVEMLFDAEEFFKIHLYNTGSGVISTKPMSEFDTQTLETETATSVHARYIDTSESTQVDVMVTVSSSLGVDMLTVSVEVALGLAGHTLWGVESPRLRALPWAPRGSINTFRPIFNGEIDTNSINGYEDVAHGYQYPGFLLPTPESIGIASGKKVRVDIETAALQLLAHYSPDSGTGILMRTPDQEVYGKLFYYDGTRGDSMLTAMLQYPANNLASVAYTSPYLVQIILFRGGIETIGRVHFDLLKRQGNWAFNHPRVLNAGSSGQQDGANNSSLLSDLAYTIWMAAHSNPSGATEEELYVRLREELDRIQEFVGSSTPALFLYGWGKASANPIVTLSVDMQDHRIHSEAEDLLTELTFPVIAYYMHNWSPSSKWYTTTKGVDPTFGYESILGAPSSLVVLDLAQSPRLSGFTAPAEDVKHYPNMGNANARLHCIDTINRAIGSEDFQGIYLDAYLGSVGGTIGDYRTALDASNKGPGSPYYNSGQVSFSQELRAFMRGLSGKSSFMLTTEFPSEVLTDGFDMVSIPVEPFDFASNKVRHTTPLFSSFFCQYMALHNFNGYVEAPPAALTEIFIKTGFLKIALMYHANIMFMFAWFGRFDHFIIMQEGDDNYQELWVDSGWGSLMEWIALLIQSRSDYRRNSFYQILPPPPGSYQDVVHSNGAPLSFSSDTGIVETGSVNIIASMVAGDDIYWGIRHFLRLTNHGELEETATIRISREQYPSIGTGINYIYEGQTFIAKFRSAGVFHFTLSPRSVRVYTITDRDVIGSPDA